MIQKPLIQMADNLEQYCVYLLGLGKKPLTIKKRIYWVKKIYSTCPDFTLEGVKDFLEEKKASGNNNNSLNIIITCIRVYAQYLGRTDILDQLKYYPADRSFVRPTLSDDQVEKLLKVRRPKRMWRKSWVIYMMVLRIIFFTGMRPREVCTLCVEDIDLGLGVIRLKPEHAKTQGIVPIPQTLSPYLRDYLLQIKGSKLFPSIKNGSVNDGYLDVATLDSFFTKLLHLAKIPKVKDLTPYSGRHTYGTRLGEEDVNMKTIMELMRHKKITTTEKYLHPGLKTLKKGQLKIPYIGKQMNPLDKLDSIREELAKFNIDRDTRLSKDFKRGLQALFFEESQRLIDKKFS